MRVVLLFVFVCFAVTFASAQQVAKEILLKDFVANNKDRYPEVSTQEFTEPLSLARGLNSQEQLIVGNEQLPVIESFNLGPGTDLRRLVVDTNAFVATIGEAFSHHRPLDLTPDDFLFPIVQASCDIFFLCFLTIF